MQRPDRLALPTILILSSIIIAGCDESNVDPDATVAADSGPGRDASDARPADANDAAFPDAAPDVGGLDAADAGEVDAGEADAAGEVDAGEVDAGEVDAGRQLPPDALLGINVFAGERYSLVIAPDRSLYAFGQYVDPVNGYYYNAGAYANTPVLVQGIDSVQQVSAYGPAFFALKTDGTVYGWGFINSYAGFGQGLDGNSGGVVTQFSPVPVLTAAATPITNVCQIVATIYGVLMLRSTEANGACTPGGARTVWYTGDSLTGYESGLTPGLFAKSYGPLDPASGENVTGGISVDRLFANAYYVNSISIYARLTNGAVYAWGSNLNGQLGVGDQLALNIPTAAPAWNGALDIISASEVTVAIMPGGGLIAAGSNLNAMLGNGSQGNEYQTTPAAVSTLTQVSHVGLSTSPSGALALENGDLFFWGSSTHFGGLATTPRAITSTSSPFLDLGMGTEHGLVLDEAGGVYSFGGNQLGELGCGACEARVAPVLVTVP